MKLVRIAHPEIEGTALVPETSSLLKRGDWQLVDEQPQADDQVVEPTETPDADPATEKKSARKRATPMKEK